MEVIQQGYITTKPDGRLNQFGIGSDSRLVLIVGG
jgi:hypothetical protein